jgi:hypothetical protein
MQNNRVQEEILQLARAILDGRYPKASAAFVAGSLLQGVGNEFSDIDLIVVFDQLPNAYREAFVWNKTPVEAFVHDPQTSRWFSRADAQSGQTVMVDMVLESSVIEPNVVICQPIRAYAETIRLAGPPALDGVTLAALRYPITGLLDDLRGDRPDAEIQAIGCTLYELAADLFLRGRGQWAARGKWIPRSLQQLDSGLDDRFADAFRMLFTQSDASHVIALLDAELARHGGPLFAGYYRDAPPDRLPRD